MKRENLDECKRIVDRLQNMEEALGFYDENSKNDRNTWSMLYINLFRGRRNSELEVRYKTDYTIAVSKEQQEELANLLRKWVEEDKRKLETL